MKSIIVLTLAISLGIGAARAQGQPANPIDGYLARAKAAAGFDFTCTGEAHPFEIGAEAVARHVQVTDECAQLARYRLQQAAAN